jgi:hypothetical protein
MLCAIKKKVRKSVNYVIKGTETDVNIIVRTHFMEFQTILHIYCT